MNVHYDLGNPSLFQAKRSIFIMRSVYLVKTKTRLGMTNGGMGKLTGDDIFILNLV
jgi:hypothetical protein